MEARSKRPLRTYGRQPAQNVAATEPAIEQPYSKRRRTEEIELDDQSPAKCTAQRTSLVSTTPKTKTIAASPRKTTTVEKIQASIIKPVAPPANALPTPPPATVRKSTITSYFRVVPHLNSESSTCSEHTAPLATSSPPSSPPPLQPDDLAPKTKRKPRRLTTRAKGRESMRKTEDAMEAREEEGNPAAEESPKSSDKNEQAMQMTAPTVLNRPNIEAKKSKKRGATDMIQQTLSLSMSDKGFTECRECNMLYNPLHEKDRKFHAQQHTAILKARLKGEGKENDVED